MKKPPLAILLILTTLLFAEKNLIVHTPDGPVAYPLTSVDSLTIEEYTPKIGPFESTDWIKYKVTQTGEHFQQVSSGTTYPVGVFHYYLSETLNGIQVRGTPALGQFASLKITYSASSKVLFGGLKDGYDLYSAETLPVTDGEETVYVDFDDFSSSLDVANCTVFEFKFYDYDTSGDFSLINFEVIQ